MPGVLLSGCRPEPMAGYLKALGVFRLVAEQADPETRGYWTPTGFRLDSRLDEAELAAFFLDRYSPTPIVAPWNSNSGFYEGDRREGMDAIFRSDSERFQEYRETIRAIQSFPEMPAGELTLGRMLECVEAEAERKTGKQRRRLIDLAEQARTAIRNTGREDFSLTVEMMKAWKSGAAKSEIVQITALLKAAKKLLTEAKRVARAGDKEQIVLACRNRLSDRAVDWLDAAVVMPTEATLDYPPVLGTGGNEGHLEYTNAFMERLANILLSSNAYSPALLRNALFGGQTEGLEKSSVGQHDPGRAGGYNQGAGIETKDFPSNHWNFVLSLEGAIAWASGVGRRQSVAASRHACSPFTVEARAVGYGSANDTDDARAEVWMPLWERPCMFEEIRCLLREGRAEIGGKAASDAIQFAEAASSLGVDRGITGFMRYSLLKRRGDSYIALPAGKFAVQDRREVDLLQDLDPLLDRLDGFKRSAGQSAAAGFLACRKAIDGAIYDVLVHKERVWMKRLLAALGRIEQYFAVRDPHKEPKLNQPLAGLTPRWLQASDDGSVEFRLAAALASIGATGKVGPLRANLSPIDPQRYANWANGSGQRAWAGSDLCGRLAGVLRRRIMDAERLGCEKNPLSAELTVAAEDAATLIHGPVDEDMIEALLFGMGLINWRHDSMRGIAAERTRVWREAAGEARVPRSWVLLKYLFLPGPVTADEGEDVVIRCEEAIVPLLCADRVKEACEIAIRRWRVSGLRPPHIGFERDAEGTRLAAALLLPVPEFALRPYFKVEEGDHV